MKTTPMSLAALLVSLAACVTTSSPPPEELANELITTLDEGKTDEARERFERVEHDAEYRDKIYPVLFGAARRRYLEGNGAGAAVLLRFLHEGYPDAVAVREALVYSMFLERASVEHPDPALTVELEQLLAEMRATEGPLPVWVDLIEAQQGIDRGDTEGARAAYERFVASWDRRPGDPVLEVYVDDIGRYLTTGTESESRR